ncbi:hypothetical protein ACWGIU_36490 [Streptomyces sp. NPDC054840]
MPLSRSAFGPAAVHATVADSDTAPPAPLQRIGFRHVRDVREDDGSPPRV